MGLKSMMENKLPGYNCGQCGFKTCEELLKSKKALTKCVFIKKDDEQDIRGVIDNLKADFILGSIKDECSCREFVLLTINKKVNKGDIIRYRPMGCPIIHFAKVFEKQGNILGVHLVGPKYSKKFKDVGICLIIGFEGIVKKGRVPELCETIKFIPEYCMMQKVHSAVVVQVENKLVKLEGIDLKVFQR